MPQEDEEVAAYADVDSGPVEDDEVAAFAGAAPAPAAPVSAGGSVDLPTTALPTGESVGASVAAPSTFGGMLASSPVGRGVAQVGRDLGAMADFIGGGPFRMLGALSADQPIIPQPPPTATTFGTVPGGPLSTLTSPGAAGLTRIALDPDVVGGAAQTAESAAMLGLPMAFPRAVGLPLASWMTGAGLGKIAGSDTPEGIASGALEGAMGVAGLRHVAKLPEPVVPPAPEPRLALPDFSTPRGDLGTAPKPDVAKLYTDVRENFTGPEAQKMVDILREVASRPETPPPPPTEAIPGETMRVPPGGFNPPVFEPRPEPLLLEEAGAQALRGLDRPIREGELLGPEGTYRTSLEKGAPQIPPAGRGMELPYEGGRAGRAWPGPPGEGSVDLPRPPQTGAGPFDPDVRVRFDSEGPTGPARPIVEPRDYEPAPPRPPVSRPPPPLAGEAAPGMSASRGRLLRRGEPGFAEEAQRLGEAEAPPERPSIPPPPPAGDRDRILQKVDLGPVAPLSREKFEGGVDRARAELGTGQFARHYGNRSGIVPRHSAALNEARRLGNDYALGISGKDFRAFKEWAASVPEEAHQLARKAIEGKPLAPEEAAYLRSSPDTQRVVDGGRRFLAEVKRAKTAGEIGGNVRVIEDGYFPRFRDTRIGRLVAQGDADALRLVNDKIEARGRSGRLTQGSLDKERLTDIVPNDNSFETLIGYMEQVIDDQAINRGVIEPANQLARELNASGRGPEAEWVDNYIRRNVKNEPSLLDRDAREIALRQIAGDESIASGAQFRSNGKMGPEGEIRVGEAAGTDEFGRKTYRVTVDGEPAPETYSDLDLLGMKHADAFLKKRPVMEMAGKMNRAASFMTIWGNLRPGVRAAAENMGSVLAGTEWRRLPKAINDARRALMGSAPELVRELREVNVWPENPTESLSGETTGRTMSKVEAAGYGAVRLPDWIAQTVGYLASKERLRATYPEWPEVKLRNEAKIEAAVMSDLKDAPFRSQVQQTPAGALGTLFLNPSARKWQQAEQLWNAKRFGSLATMFGVPAATLAGTYTAVGGDWRRAREVFTDMPVMAVLTEGAGKAGPIAARQAKELGVALWNQMNDGATASEMKKAIPMEGPVSWIDAAAGAPGRLVTTSVRAPEFEGDRAIKSARRKAQKQESYLNEGAKKRRR